MSSNNIVRKSLLSAAVAAASLNAGVVAAAQIEEVIVTTQKRAQPLQDVPISVSAFTGSFIEKAQISDAKAMAMLTPGVSGDTDDSFLDLRMSVASAPMILVWVLSSIGIRTVFI